MSLRLAHATRQGLTNRLEGIPPRPNQEEVALQTGVTIQIQHDGTTYSLGPILNPAGLIAVLTGG